MKTGPEKSNDGEVVSAVLAGDTDRFAEIADRYQASLLRVARSRLGDPGRAEDAVQETFLSAFKSLHTYDSIYSFRTWLWTILLNQCRRAAKKQAARKTVQEIPDGDESSLRSAMPGPASLLLAKERAALLEDLLATLPESRADALRLRFFGNLKFQEIADTMGCGLSTAKLRVRSGLTRISAAMKEFAVPFDTEPPASRS